jgi:microcystin-dependent protein
MEAGTTGEIRLFAGDFEPPQWSFCDGKALDTREYMSLFSVIGTKYGGDGRVNFQLPNLEPLKAPDGSQTSVRYVICLSGVYPERY